jgi:hypothetical protein
MVVAQPTFAAENHGPEVCPNCGVEFLDDFCHHCGEQKHHSEELTLKHFFLHATHDLTHLDAKIFATLRYLFTRPGFLTQEFLAGRRTRYMRPFSMFLVACAIFFLADSVKPISGYDVHQLTVLDKSGRVDAAWEQLAKARHVSKEIIEEKIQDTLHRASTAAQIFNALAMAAVLALFFRKRYFVEHLVFSLHYLSFTYLGAVLLSPLNSALGVISARNIASAIGVTLIFMAYLFLSLRRVYRQGAIATFFKMVVTYAATQVVILVTLNVVLVVAIVRAAKAK